MYNRGMDTMTDRKNSFVVRPFYIFITVLMGIFGWVSFLAFWQQGQVLYALLCIFLAALHISLYWFNLSKFENDRWRIFYYLAQASIIIIFTLLPHPNEAYGGLSFVSSATITIIAEGLGLWGNTRRALYIGLSFVVLMVVLFSLEVERAILFDVLSQVLINGTFIIMAVFILNQQLRLRERAEEFAEELESANAKLAAYAARNESLTLQSERERMARELHDTLAQGVAGLVMQLEAIKAHQQQGQYLEAGQVVTQALSRARNTLKESRSAIEDLRNDIFDFQKTVKAMLEQFSASSKTKFELDLALDPEAPLPQHVQHHARRVLYEALTNIQKHAQASVAHVAAIQHSNMLELCIRDDGVGFNVQRLPVHGCFGLQGFQERAQLTDSRYMLTSSLNAGTMIEFVFPLDTYD